MFRHLLIAATLLAVCGSLQANDKVSVAITIGGYTPTATATADEFGTWSTRIGFTTFDRQKPTKWRFTWEIGNYSLSGNTGRKVELIPLAFGVQKGLNSDTHVQPYVALRGGPYYGRVSGDAPKETEVGLNLNAAVGVIFERNFYAEVRYDYFSEIQNTSFDGVSLSVGARVFDF